MTTVMPASAAAATRLFDPIIDDDINNDNINDDDGLEEELGIRATYTCETFTFVYHPHHHDGHTNNNDHDYNQEDRHDLHSEEEDNNKVQVKVWYAATTLGGPLTAPDHYDTTGIMIWPASHVLCQAIVQHGISHSRRSSHRSRSSSRHYSHAHYWNMQGKNVIELGCGVGLVGVVTAATYGAAFQQQQAQPQAQTQETHETTPRQLLYVSTDGNDRALRLCRMNHRLNGMDMNDNRKSIDSSECQSWVRPLKWGNQEHIQALLSELRHYKYPSQFFDTVLAADIVYPSTSDQALRDLFATVHALLGPSSLGGVFFLSYASRDSRPHTTAIRLLEAASSAGFALLLLVMDKEGKIQKSSSLLNSQILIFQHRLKVDNTDANANEQLPYQQQHQREIIETLFPGLHAAIKKSKHNNNKQAATAMANSDEEAEEWDAPPIPELL